MPGQLVDLGLDLHQLVLRVRGLGDAERAAPDLAEPASAAAGSPVTRTLMIELGGYVHLRPAACRCPARRPGA